MTRNDQNAYTNDIVSQLNIQCVGFGGPGAFGAPFFNVQGLLADGRQLLGNTHEGLGHNCGGSRYP
jgi:hypothetical protein